NIDASYSPEGLDVPTMFVGSDKIYFQSVLTAKGSTLEISRIQIDQGKAKYASGYVSLPFVWKNIGTSEPLFPSDGTVLVTFQSENLDLKKLFEDLGTKPLATGLINVKLNANGTLAQLSGRLDVQMSDLHSADYPKLEPATFDLLAELANNQLAFNGKLQQTKIQPVQITGNLPFDLSKIIDERKFDEETPLNAKVQLPRSSVNFLRQFLPALIQLDGDLALDANVHGTIAKPVLSGSGDITINMARFSNATLPALSGFHSRLNFDGDVLNFERFNGDLAGGPFTISGRVTFPKLTEPNLDFELKAQSILIARNDSLTARADADLRVTGPWASATVTGNVALTNSQFLKNIDLIPIGLPGRPAPQPPSDRPDFSVPEPPIRDWKFDVAVKTKDAFLLRGNLANGGAIVDLHLTGTGLRPALQGMVRLENVEATLPFSRLEIAQGFLYFDPSDSFNPKIDLQGTSLIRDYTVHVFVYGTSLAPEAVFSSEPPLPQEEIISLLATGVTRGELAGNNNVLAGRAAMLLIQQLYQKVFKKGQATKSNSAFDRLQVDIGQVDPRTGQQTATARFKVNDKFVLVGDLGVGGDFRGMVKYLIRFK
ncbi:MAG: translocation and assembly module TamB, partial [Verrucomicrobiota bacterium]